MVLLHAPSSGKRLTHHVKSKDRTRHWSQRTAALARLLSAKWQPLPPHLDLELRVEPAVLAAGAAATRPQLPSVPPPSSIAQHVSRLTLSDLSLTLADLAAWQLHDPARWPHLQHLTVQLCGLPLAATAAAAEPLQPIPRLQSFTWQQRNKAQGVAALLSLVRNAERAHLALSPFTGSGDCFVAALRCMPRLLHVRLDGPAIDDAARAALQHPTLQHVEATWLDVDEDLSGQPCRWKTLSLLHSAYLYSLKSLPLAGLERLTIAHGMAQWIDDHERCAAGVAALQRLHSLGRLVLAPSTDADADDVAVWRLAPGELVF